MRESVCVGMRSYVCTCALSLGASGKEESIIRHSFSIRKVHFLSLHIHTCCLETKRSGSISQCALKSRSLPSFHHILYNM